jgi:hypothetical protein
MPIPKDAHYVPGTSRHQVRLSDGDIVTRSAAENMFAQERGYTGNYQRRKAFRNQPLSRTNLKDAERKGPADTVRERREEYKEAEDRLRAAYANSDNKYDRLDKSPNGPLAKYLESIGRRSAGADYAVGETPSIK